MTTIEDLAGWVEDRGEAIGGGAAEGVSPGGGEPLRLPPAVVADLAAELVARARAGQPVRLTGKDGLLGGVIGQVLEAGLALELDEHLRLAGPGNERNGSTAKTLRTEAGPVTVSVPRDRAGTFDPVLVPKGARRTSGVSEAVVSLYAGGMSVRDRLLAVAATAIAAAAQGARRATTC